MKITDIQVHLLAFDIRRLGWAKCRINDIITIDNIQIVKEGPHGVRFIIPGGDLMKAGASQAIRKALIKKLLPILNFKEV